MCQLSFPVFSFNTHTVNLQRNTKFKLQCYRTRHNHFIEKNLFHVVDANFSNNPIEVYFVGVCLQSTSSATQGTTRYL